MEVVGLCALCGAPGAMHTCALCGRNVCGLHFEHRAGACTMHGGAGGGGPPAHGRT